MRASPLRGAITQSGLCIRPSGRRSSLRMWTGFDGPWLGTRRWRLGVAILVVMQKTLECLDILRVVLVAHFTVGYRPELGSTPCRIRFGATFTKRYKPAARILPQWMSGTRWPMTQRGSS